MISSRSFLFSVFIYLTIESIYVEMKLNTKKTQLIRFVSASFFVERIICFVENVERKTMRQQLTVLLVLSP